MISYQGLVRTFPKASVLFVTSLVTSPDTTQRKKSCSMSGLSLLNICPVRYERFLVFFSHEVMYNLLQDNPVLEQRYDNFKFEFIETVYYWY
ncbi:hypothetical protein DU321_26015 [Escherichia coli]|uniref:Uncharacterized protein n=1 Tax=Escherichia coli TaxID=562 RepID=A0A426ELD1_ECOLX|nr:hypothetical protein DU321_26015 [Escherichia coli]